MRTMDKHFCANILRILYRAFLKNNIDMLKLIVCV